MEDQFVPYKTALKLKELDFNEKCLGRIYADGYVELLPYPYKSKDNTGSGTSCSAPLWQQATDWLRDKHGIIVCQDIQTMACSYDASKEHFQFKLMQCSDTGVKNILHPRHQGLSFSSYYEGLNFFINEALNLIGNEI